MKSHCVAVCFVFCVACSVPGQYVNMYVGGLLGLTRIKVDHYTTRERDEPFAFSFSCPLETRRDMRKTLSRTLCTVSASISVQHVRCYSMVFLIRAYVHFRLFLEFRGLKIKYGSHVLYRSDALYNCNIEISAMRCISIHNCKL